MKIKMNLLFRLLFKLLPWVALILVLFYVFNHFKWPFKNKETPATIITHNTILEKVEALGKLEMVKYNFQEVTTLTEKNERYLGIFPAGDSKVILISNGEAVGCIDLTKIKAGDINFSGDSLIVYLPEPEICYYKLNLEKTKIYAVEKGVYYKKENELIERAYKLAENEIKQAALNADILNKTWENATVILQPLLEEIAGQKVYFGRHLSEGEILEY